MASVFIGTNRGQSPLQVNSFTIGATTGSTDVELRIDQTKSLTKKDVVLVLKGLEVLLSSNAPGATTILPL